MENKYPEAIYFKKNTLTKGLEVNGATLAALGKVKVSIWEYDKNTKKRTSFMACYLSIKDIAVLSALQPHLKTMADNKRGSDDSVVYQSDFGGSKREDGVVSRTWNIMAAKQSGYMFQIREQDGAVTKNGAITPVKGGKSSFVIFPLSNVDMIELIYTLNLHVQADAVVKHARLPRTEE